MQDKRVREREAAASCVEAFAIDSPCLPPEIEGRAFSSGDFPHDKKLKREIYDEELPKLQVELLKLLDWLRDEGERIVLVFEGRDAAGKGGTIARLTQHLNPRFARVAALGKPSSEQQGQWYFQRYVPHLPTRGEMTIFDRSWYNRAVVEPVFGFATQAETEAFLGEAPRFEAMLARDGVRLVKFFLSIGREMQMKRLHARHHDPLKRWKLSELDYKAIDKWDEFSAAIEAMLMHTDSAAAPWTVIRANDKLRTRLETIRHVLDVIPYAGKDMKVIGQKDREIVLSAASFLGAGGEQE
jgi:polyphosphate kinase 2